MWWSKGPIRGYRWTQTDGLIRSISMIGDTPSTYHQKLFLSSEKGLFGVKLKNRQWSLTTSPFSVPPKRPVFLNIELGVTGQHTRTSSTVHPSRGRKYSRFDCWTAGYSRRIDLEIVILVTASNVQILVISESIATNKWIKQPGNGRMRVHNMQQTTHCGGGMRWIQLSLSHCFFQREMVTCPPFRKHSHRAEE